MAKVTIAMTDLPNGEVGLEVVNDPPTKAGTELTPAQRQAVVCLKGMAVDLACKRLGREYRAASAAGEEQYD